MKPNICGENNKQSLRFKETNVNKKIQSLKSCTQFNTAQNLIYLMKKFSHQPSSSGTKLSYCINLSHSVGPKSISPKYQKINNGIISKNVIDTQKKDLTDKIKEKEKKIKYKNLRSYFQNPSRKSLKPTKINLKGDEANFEDQLIKQNFNPAHVISNFYTYSNLSNRNNSNINKKYSTNITSLNNKGIEKKIEFSKIHEKLTRNITEIKATESSIEVINLMSETYLTALSDLISVLDNEISTILKVIYCGLKTSFEFYLKKIESIPDFSNKENKLTKKCTILQEQLKVAKENIKESGKTIKIQEEKLRNSDFELGRLKDELQLYKDKDLQKLKAIKSLKEGSSLGDIEALKNKLHVHKKRENKLIYFYNLLEEKGYPIKQIYESQIKSITTERFTSNCDSEFTNNNEDLKAEEKEENNENNANNKNKFDFIPLLNISNISHKSSEVKEEDKIQFDFNTEEKHDLVEK